MAWLQVARGSPRLTSEGVVHRDSAGARAGRCDGRVRIGDFGLAVKRARGSARGSRSTRITSFVAVGLAGTPAYMSPEQWHGEADARSDQYWLFVSLWLGADR